MADLKAAAQEYFSIGCNIVSVKNKTPLVSWSQWQNQRQSQEEFEGLPWNRANQFAVLCGQRLENELYLAVLDYDVKNVGEEAKQKGKEVLKHLLTTQRELTPSGGEHWIYYSHVQPKTVSAYHNEAAVELLGTGKLCILHPSQSYEKINDNLPSTVQDLEALFYEALEKAGVKPKHDKKKEAWFDRTDLSGKPFKGKAPPCIERLISGADEGQRNEFAVRLSAYLVNFRRLDSQNAWKELLQWNKWNSPPLPDSELWTAFQSAVKNRYVYGCSDSILASLCEKENCTLTKKQTASSPEKKKKQLKDSGLTADGCFEAIYHNGKPSFLVKNSENFSIVESLEIDGQVFSPKEAKHIPYEPYGYFEGTVPKRQELFSKIRTEFQIFIDVESIWKDVLSAFVLLSYQQEKLQTAPYIFLYGDNESGKSTVLQLLKFLCYRPMYAVTCPSADLYGYLEDSDSIGTVLEDEIQGINKDVDKVKIYKAGYKRGSSVPRTIITQHDRIIKYYGVFSLKACASEQLPSVKGFRERFLEISMTEGFPEKEWSDLTQDDIKRLHDLRNTLLKWRMLSRDWQLPDVRLDMKGRLKELWKPILQITSGLTVYDSLFKFVEEQRKERLSVKQDTLEGKIVKVVTEIFNEAKEEPYFTFAVPFQTIWSRLQEELDGKIDDKKPNVMDTSEFFNVTKNKVGYRLREILSGKTKVLREKDAYGSWISTKAYQFDLTKLRRVAKKYGYEVVTKLQTLPSSSGVQAPESMETMEKTDGKNVEKELHTPQELSKLSNSVTNGKEPSLSSKNAKYENAVGKKDSNSVTIFQEVLEKLRFVFVEGTEQEWIGLAVESGLSEKDAEALFESLKGEELFWLDRPSDGKTVWRWVKQ